jgi:hypothetical protein
MDFKKPFGDMINGFRKWKNACIEGTVTTEQVGGRPGQRAVDLATATVIKYETIRLQKLQGGLMYNDVKV